MGRVLAKLASIAAVVALASAPVPALAAPKAAVQATGNVSGDLKAGNLLTVRLTLIHPNGWQNFQHVEVALRLHGRPLDQLTFESSDISLAIAGDGSPVVLGQPGQLKGPFFRVDTSKVGLNATGNSLRLTIPIHLLLDPPPGGRLFYTYTANGVPTVGFKPLTPPVEAKSGFSWGTLAVAIAAALFAGGFLGNLVASNRRRQVRPSIYAAVSRRSEEERTRK